MALVDLYIDGDNVVFIFEDDVLVLSIEETKELKKQLTEIL